MSGRHQSIISSSSSSSSISIISIIISIIIISIIIIITHPAGRHQHAALPALRLPRAAGLAAELHALRGGIYIYIYIYIYVYIHTHTYVYRSSVPPLYGAAPSPA